MARKPRQIELNLLGKKWLVGFVDKVDDLDSDGETIQREIRVAKSLDDGDMIETVVHEILHAADWKKSEVWVASVASQVRRVLHEHLGFRRPE